MLRFFKSQEEPTQPTSEAVLSDRDKNEEKLAAKLRESGFTDRFIEYGDTKLKLEKKVEKFVRKNLNTDQSKWDDFEQDIRGRYGDFLGEDETFSKALEKLREGSSKAREFLDQEQFDHAERELQHALEKKIVAKDIYFMLGDVYLHKKALREAEEEERRSLEKLMNKVEGKGGQITIISTEHEAGMKLLSVGGIAALLRFPFN